MCVGALFFYEGGRRPTEGAERECCLLVLNSVTSTPQWIRQPEAAWLETNRGGTERTAYNAACVYVCVCVCDKIHTSFTHKHIHPHSRARMNTLSWVEAYEHVCVLCVCVYEYICCMCVCDVFARVYSARALNTPCPEPQRAPHAGNFA